MTIAIPVFVNGFLEWVEDFFASRKHSDKIKVKGVADGSRLATSGGAVLGTAEGNVTSAGPSKLEHTVAASLGLASTPHVSGRLLFMNERYASLLTTARNIVEAKGYSPQATSAILQRLGTVQYEGLSPDEVEAYEEQARHIKEDNKKELQRPLDMDELYEYVMAIHLYIE